MSPFEIDINDPNLLDFTFHRVHDCFTNVAFVYFSILKKKKNNSKKHLGAYNRKQPYPLRATLIYSALLYVFCISHEAVRTHVRIVFAPPPPPPPHPSPISGRNTTATFCLVDIIFNRVFLYPHRGSGF